MHHQWLVSVENLLASFCHHGQLEEGLALVVVVQLLLRVQHWVDNHRSAVHSERRQCHWVSQRDALRVHAWLICGRVHLRVSSHFIHDWDKQNALLIELDLLAHIIKHW